MVTNTGRSVVRAARTAAHIGQRGLRFNCKKIDARLIECSDLLAVQVVYVVKVGLTKRGDEQAAGTDITAHQYPAWFCNALCQAHQLGVQFYHAPFQTIGGEQSRIRPKGWSKHCLGTCIDVCIQ